VPEPLGGAHRDSETTIDAVGAAIEAALRPLNGRSGTELRADRRAKFLGMGKHGL
jgi:acetyl-CoA carboxylase carboxyl transferase subunit alpha